MHRTLSVTLTLIVFAFSLVATVLQAQDSPQSDLKIIDDFINSRGASYGEPPRRPKPKRRLPTPTARKPPSQGANPKAAERVDEKPASPAATKQKANGSGDNKASADFQPANARRISLGYTLVMKRANDHVVVDEAREFKFEDGIRVLLEPNTNGYLYIFQTQDGVPTQMLYPQATLNEGWNGIGAHTREYVPVDGWYEFAPPAGVAQLYVILSLKPLEGVPLGDELIESCGGQLDDCYWQPKPSEWERIKRAAPTDAVEAKNLQLASVQTSLLGDPLTRGLRLKKESPAPAVVRVNSLPSASALMTVISLVFK